MALTVEYDPEIPEPFMSTFGHIIDPEIPAEIVSAYQEYVDSLPQKTDPIIHDKKGRLINEPQCLEEMREGTVFGRQWTQVLIYHATWQSLSPDVRQAAELNPNSLIDLTSRHFRNAAIRMRETF